MQPEIVYLTDNELAAYDPELAGLFKSIKKAFKKVVKVAKKVAPVAALAIPGVGGVVAKVLATASQASGGGEAEVVDVNAPPQVTVIQAPASSPVGPPGGYLPSAPSPATLPAPTAAGTSSLIWMPGLPGGLGPPMPVSTAGARELTAGEKALDFLKTPTGMAVAGGGVLLLLLAFRRKGGNR